MPQLKGRHTHARFFQGDTRERAAKLARTADDDRDRLIRECLKDLKGVELLYAVRCQDGAIKVGYTADIRNRRKFFGGTPEDLLFIQPGTYDDEQAVHAMLAPHLARGSEYYHPTPEVLAYVNGVRTTLGLDPI